LHAIHQPALLALAFLQAGGGGSFGGGGGGGGDGGDGDGLLWVLYWLIRLAIEVPLIGVPLLVFALVIAVVGSRKGWWKHQERTIRRAQPQRLSHRSAQQAQTLRGLDAAFDEARFLARVRAAFEKAQSSWCRQELEPLRAFVSDGVFERFTLQIEEQKLDGWRQGMDAIRIGKLAILHVEPGQHFDTLSVLIPFEARIDRRSLADGAPIAGSQLPVDEFRECWSFVRRRGARSSNGEGLMEGRCPNCGAPLLLNQSARCGQCECLVRSGQFDWVLAEITQFSEWKPESEAQVPGLAHFAQRDPGFNLQLLEDRASLAFWRLCAAQRAGSIDPLTRIASPALCARYLAALVPEAGGTRTYTGECAVGSVRSLGLLGGEPADRAVVEVVWDGRSARVSADGKRTLETRRHLRRTLFVFTRRAGTLTQLEDTLTTATCRSCGAHDVGGTRPDCPWCGAPRADASTQWMLAEIQERGAAQALLEELARLRALPPPLPPASARAPRPESAAGLLTWAAALARSDGDLDEREQRAVHALGARLSMQPARVAEILHDDLAGTGPAADDQAQGREWFHTLAELSLADGSLSKAERGFLNHAADRLGMSHREAEHALAAARTKLYGESREAVRSVVHSG